MQSSGGAHFSLHKQINLSSPGLTEGVQYDIIKAIGSEMHVSKNKDTILRF